MIHKKVFATLLITTVSCLVFLIAGLLIRDFNLIKITIIGSIVFNSLTLYFVFKWPRIESKEKKVTFQTLFSLLEPLNEGVIIYQENKVVYANRKLLEIAGLSLEEITALSLKSDLTERERFRLLGDILFPYIKGENIQIISKTPEVIKVDFRDPERHYYISFYDIELGGEKCEIKIVTDITKEILQLQQQKDFITLIAHHLRTPLNHLKWFLESLDREKLKDEIENLNQAIASINNLIFVIEELTLAYEIENNIMMPAKIISMKNVILKVIDNLRELINMKKLTVNVEVEADAYEIAGDERLFYLMLYTFVENAVVYNKEGGFVDINVKALKDKPYNLIIIKDSGIGMSEEDKKKLFQKMFRSESAKKIKGEGLGLGLYLSKKIIDSYGAKISFESRENEGTTFKIEWPRQIELIPRSSL